MQAAGGSASAINKFLIEIRTTSRKGKPTTTVLASYQTPAFDRPSSGQTTPQVATLGSPALVKKDKRCALVLTVTGGSPSVQMNRKGCAGNLFEDTNKDDKFVKERAGFGKVVFSTVVTQP